METEVYLTGDPIDYELAELLGEKAGEFLVLHLDGVRVERFGTPYNTAANRAEWDGFVASLNDRSKKSLWPEFWKNWAVEISLQFKFPAIPLAKEFRPQASYAINRVVAGRSKYLHCAIRLFEEVECVKLWSIVSTSDTKLIDVLTVDKIAIHETGTDLPLTICKAVLRALKSSPQNA
jgi:hypothetical protein